MERKHYPILDITKFVLSLFIVAIHSELYPELLYPWLRIAVPMFFIISSFLFFERVNSSKDNIEKIDKLKKYVGRLFCLYIFYFIFTSWMFFKDCHFFDDSFFLGLLKTIKSFVFRTLFPTGWYIMATIIGTCVVFYISQKISSFVSLLVGLFSFCFVALFSSYSFVVKDLAVDFREYAFSPEFSFLVSLGFISFGEAASKFKNRIIGMNRKKCIITFLLMCVFMFLLYYEWTFIKDKTGIITEDVLLMLYPLCVCIFILILQIGIHSFADNPTILKMRSVSTITYLSHFVILNLLRLVANRLFGGVPSLILFIFTIVICWLLSLFILRFEKCKYLKWLKYSH